MKAQAQANCCRFKDPSAGMALSHRSKILLAQGNNRATILLALQGNGTQDFACPPLSKSANTSSKDTISWLDLPWCGIPFCERNTSVMWRWR
jgi:hypothetical protein